MLLYSYYRNLFFKSASPTSWKIHLKSKSQSLRTLSFAPGEYTDPKVSDDLIRNLITSVSNENNYSGAHNKAYIFVVKKVLYNQFVGAFLKQVSHSC